MLVLRGDGGYMAIARIGFFLRGGPLVDATVPAVVTDTVRIVVFDPGVVNVMNFVDVHVVHGAVVVKVVTIPAAAFITVAEIAESIIDAAIPADVRAPITFMEEIAAIAPSPVAGCPEEANFRSFDPGSGNPVIIISIGIPSPVSGGPDIAVTRTDGLFINGNGRRSETDRNAYPNLCERCRRNG